MPITCPTRRARSRRLVAAVGGFSIAVVSLAAVLTGPAGAVDSSAGLASGSVSDSTAASATAGPTGAPDGAAANNLNSSRATFGVGPLSLRQGDDRSYFSYQMGPGAVYSDKAVVVNYGVTSLKLTVFAADLGNSGDGGIAVGLQDDQPKDAGAWVQLGGRTLTASVPGRTAKGPGRVLVPFTIRVPRNAAPGDHGAAIVAQLSTLGKNPKGQNVRLDQRVASRIYLRVNGVLHPQLTIDDLKVSYGQSMNPIGGSVATVSYTVHNSGNVRLSAQQAVSVTGMFGTKSKVVTPAGVQLLFPGGSQQVQVRVPGVFPAIFQKSHVTVTPSLFQDQKPMAVPTAVASASFTAIPLMLLLCILAVIVLVVLILLLRKRMKGRPQAKHGRNGGPKKPTGPSSPTRTPQTIGS